MTFPAVPADSAPHLPVTVRSETRWLRPELVAPWWEVALVLAVMLGPFIYSSTRYVLTNGSNNYISVILTDHKFVGLIATESFLLAGMFGYLHWRGWKPADFCMRRSWQGSAIAPLLAFCAYVVNSCTVALLLFVVLWLSPHPHGFLAAFVAQAPHIERHSIDVTWLSIFAGSILNAFLEELVFMGYGFNQFAAKRGPFFALVLMVLLRMLLHTYQGPVHMLGIGAFSLFFGLAYWYMRRLWPLIAAHAMIDVGGFSVIKLVFGQ